MARCPLLTTKRTFRLAASLRSTRAKSGKAFPQLMPGR
jgi:hypothetical protein